MRGVSVDIASGELVHVAGPNGAGKSTLLRVIAGLLLPEEGAVTWGGRPIEHDRDAYCAVFAYLGHRDGLKPELRADENLGFAVGLRRSVSAAEIDDVLDRVGLADAGHRYAGVLSAGQRRRLALARVILSAVPLWLLDEPFTNLDAAGAELACELAARHLDAGGAIVMAAHRPPAIGAVQARTVFLS